MRPSTDLDCGHDSCTVRPPHTAIATLSSLLPFIVTFAVVSLVVPKHVFPRLSRVQDLSDSEDHCLPASAPSTLQKAHAEYGARSASRRVAAVTFAVTVGLAAVLGELILAEISGMVDAHARAAALRFTIPAILCLLVVVIPFLEVQSVVIGWGWSFKRTAKGRIPHLAWGLQLAVFSAWLFVFWSLGRLVSFRGPTEYLLDRMGVTSLDSTGAMLGHAVREEQSVSDVVGGGRLSRACLERIGIIGIGSLAALSGFASVSSPWHTFADNRAYRKRPVTDADIVRKQVGLEMTSETLVTKRHRLRSLQCKAEASSHDMTARPAAGGLVGKMLGSWKSMGGDGGSDAAEIRALQIDISGLETMEAHLSTSLSMLRNRQAEHARDGTTLGRLLAIPSHIFALYCVYRVLATTLTTIRRIYYPSATFSSSDPINRFLGLLAKHWDPKLDQIAWARQISFLLSGVILLASANSVVQTFRLFAKWTPGLLYQAQANLALLIGQLAATYVISAALLLRSNLPKEVGQSVGDALESALEPGFVDRWFEAWFLLASAATAAGIWIGKKIAGPGEWDDFEDYAGEEMGQKRS